MKKILIFAASTLLFLPPSQAELKEVGPAPKYVKPEEKTRSKKGRYGIIIAVSVVAVGIVALLVASNQHSRHEHGK